MISRVYTSRFGNGTGSHGTSTEVVLKKYQVPGTVPSGKPPKSEPYRTVPCRTTQWKSAIGHLVWSCPKLYEFWSVIFRFYSVAYSCDLSPDPEIAVFGWSNSLQGLGHQIKKAVQYGMVVAKKIILCQWKNVSKPLFKYWLSELSATLHLERLRYNLFGNIAGFEATWEPFLKHLTNVQVNSLKV